VVGALTRLYGHMDAKRLLEVGRRAAFENVGQP